MVAPPTRYPFRQVIREIRTVAEPLIPGINTLPDFRPKEEKFLLPVLYP